MNADGMFVAETANFLPSERIIVLDANAAIEVAEERPMSTLFSEKLASASLVVASEFIAIELANVLQKQCRGGDLTEQEARQTIERALGLVHQFSPIETDYAEALHEAIRLKHSAYDMLYLILARRYGATLMTLDGKLKQLAIDEGIDVY
jgi:predicted nucleic acid-binding protein